MFRFIHKVLVGAFLALPLLLGGDAVAQCSGVFTAGQICGNDGASSAAPRGSTFAGVDRNTVSAKTTNYTMLTTDCGKTIALGGTAFYTLTVGAASGFPASCSINVVNTDSGRAKLMAINGITVGHTNKVWPKQSFILKNVSNVWTVIGLPPFWELTGAAAFFVDTAAGSDSNDGLATGAGNAFATIQKAITNVCDELDLNSNTVSITTTAATYTEHLALCQYRGIDPTDSYTQVTITMTGATLSATGGSGIGIFSHNSTSPFTFKDTTFTNCGTACVEGDSGGYVALDNPTFSAVSGNHVMSLYQSRIVFITNGYTISGGAAVHWYTQYGGLIFIQPGKTVTVASPAFSSYFAYSTRNGIQNFTSTTFSVTAPTGVRYFCDTGGGIDTNGGGAAFLPGNAAGSCANPGWYN